MTATRLPITVQLDVALAKLLQTRERLVAGPAFLGRDAEVARAYELEAQLWSVLFERAHDRLIWRAALAAEAHARCWAAYWRNRAAHSDLNDSTARLGGVA
ncbi:hypothetical protein [Pseudonocardia sp.]|uniref:hypothetical protein n=1 Tax=Pseudonocardia sp. TaxID=60912 RepID=UPI0026059E95|nr:hypothetical protein [Pseudonocardia sp.]